MAPGEIPAHAEAHPGVVLRSQQLGDILQPVVPPGTPPGTHTQRAERQRNVVRNHQQVFRGDLLGLHPVTDGFARKVHVGRGFQQDQRTPLMLQLGHIAVTRRRKNSVGRLGEGVQHFESDVVPGSGIFGADISQPNNKVFHTLPIRLVPPHRAMHGLRALRRRPSKPE